MKKTSSRSLGQILLSQGVITEKQLEDALMRQETRAVGKRLGDVLVSYGYITSQHLAEALSFQMGLPIIELSKMEIPPETIALIPGSIAKIYQVIPLGKEDSLLSVAMADPTDFRTIDNLHLILNCEVRPVISTTPDIKMAIKKYYGIEEMTVDSMLSQVSGDSMSSMGSMGSMSSMSVSSLSMDSVELDSTMFKSIEKEYKKAGKEEDEEAGLIRYVTLLILEAYKKRASDIHIEPFEKDLRIRYRIDGLCHTIDPPPKGLQNSILSRLKLMAGMDIAERRVPQDGRIKIQLMGKDIDIRASALPGIWGESFVMRLLDKSSLTLDLTQLGYSRENLAMWESLLDKTNGIILVTGPTGSGKTTTLYASLNTINNPKRKIITVENPVEYVLSGINQVHVDEDIGRTFAIALRAMMRQSPDIIMVGEIRDTETAEIAIRAALTGHLVFSTLHTNDSAGALNRLIDMGAKPFLVASSVQAITAQRLLRTICKNCKVPYKPTKEELESMDLQPEWVKDVTFHKGAGCASCHNSGYLGRTTLLEILLMNDEIRTLTSNRTPSVTLKTRGRMGSGLRTLREDGYLKVFNGVTTISEVLRITAPDEPFPGKSLEQIVREISEISKAYTKAA